jgi:hypothetical protein
MIKFSNLGPDQPPQPFRHLPKGSLFIEDFSDEQQVSALDDMEGDWEALEVHTETGSWRLAVPKHIIPVATEVFRLGVPERVRGFGNFDRLEESRAIVLMLTPWYWANLDIDENNKPIRFAWLCCATAFLLRHEVSCVQSTDFLHPVYTQAVEQVILRQN